MNKENYIFTRRENLSKWAESPQLTSNVEKLLKYLIIFVLVFFISSKGYCAKFSFESEPDTGIATFPAGTMFKVISQETVSTRENSAGEPVSYVLPFEIVVGKKVCIPADTLFLGQILEVSNAKPGRDAYLRIIVTELIFPDGLRSPLSGRIWGNAESDMVGGAITQRTEYKKVPHYIQDMGPVLKLVKKGARVMGQERAIPANTEVIIVLERDLQIKYLEGM